MCDGDVKVTFKITWMNGGLQMKVVKYIQRVVKIINK